MPTPPRIFISYARADDEPFAKRLYEDLKDDNDFEVWWDRVSMPNRGLTFLQEIREAIDGCDRLLLVAGPNAFTSKYVIDEWRHAYENYKGINIALRLGDYIDLPSELKGFDAPDFRDDARYTECLATLRRQLTEPVAPIGQLHGVPALPPHFLNRPDVLDALRALVIADVDKPTLITAEKRTTAVEGMGGIGKSAVATAFAYDRKVRFAFPDGIVWLTVGRKPSLFELYRAVGVALGDDFRNYPDETTARQNAQKMLGNKKCLIILDDVWELTAARAFRDLISGTTTRLLITTRNLQINDLLGANEYSLKLIGQTQAADYLRSWVGDDPDLEKVAQKLGYLFLALKLAGARMKRGKLSGAKYLQTFDRVSRMKIDSQSAEREDNLEVSITLSVDAAFAGAETNKLLYHTLGIFEEDTPIPQQTLLQLWQHLRPDVDEFDLGETLNALVDLALVERDDHSIVTLHDLLHSYTREQLGEHYVQTHHDLLTSYGIASWHELPSDEPYLWRNIAYHLIQGKQADRLYALLTDYHWLQAKLDATDSGALEADCTAYLKAVTDGETVQIVWLIQSALSMSGHILTQDKTQLPYQLTGRLWTHREKAGIAALWQHAQRGGALELLATQQHPPMRQAGGALIRTLAGHTDGVTGALQLKNGRVLSWSLDNTPRLWSPDGQPLATLTGHTLGVTGAMQLKDGRVLSWSKDTTLRLWPPDGQPLTTLTGHTYGVKGAMQLADGRLLSWSWDETLRLWTPDGQPLATLTGHTAGVTGAMQLADGRILSWAGEKYSEDHTLRLWSPDGQPLATLTGHNKEVKGALQLADGRILSWSSDRTLRLWSPDGQPLATLTGHTGSVEGAVQLADGRLLSWSRDRTLRLWSPDGQPLATLTGHTLGVRSALQLADGRLLSWAGRRHPGDDTLRLWSPDGQPLATLTGHTSEIGGALQLADGKVLSWSRDNTLRLWSTDAQATEEDNAHASAVRGILRLSDGRLLSWPDDGTISLQWLDAGTIRLWSPDGHPLATLTGNTPEVGGVLQLADGRLLSWSYKTLRLWSPDGHPLATLTGHIDSVEGALQLVNGRILSWSYDETLRLWSPDGHPLATLTDHIHEFWGALQLADGRLLSWSYKTLRLWSPDGRLTTLIGHDYPVSGALQLADGRLLSWSWDKTLRLWSPDGQLLAILTGHTSWVWGALQLPDGRLLSWSADETLRLWSPDGHPLAALTGHTIWVNGAVQLADGRLLSSSRDRSRRRRLSDGQPIAHLDDWLSQQARFEEWAEAHGVDVRVLYEHDPSAPESPYAWVVGNRLWVHGVGEFIGDARFEQVAVSGQTIVVGDDVGRVIFLRVRGGG